MHTRANVVLEQYLTVCMRYRSLPDPRTLDLDEIEIYYEGLVPQLIEDSKPRT